MRTSAGLCNFSCPRGRRVPSKLVRSLIKGRLGAFSPDIYLFSNVYKPPPILCVLGIFGDGLVMSSLGASRLTVKLAPSVPCITTSCTPFSTSHLIEGKFLNFIGVCVGMCYCGGHVEARGQHAVLSSLLLSSEAWAWNSGFLEARTFPL